MTSVMVNRAPVLTLWAAIVAERLGFDEDEALTLGRSMAGLNAHSKAVGLGLAKPSEGRKRRTKVAEGEELRVLLLGREVPAVQTKEGVRALDKNKPSSPDAVRRYLQGKFKEALPEVTDAMQTLAKSMPPQRLAEHALGLYERFRPGIPKGTRGWGARGELDVGEIRKLAKQSKR